MQLTFPSNKITELSFKIGIAGTQTSPSTVAVVLERDGKSLSFNAIKTGDEWAAKIDKPGSCFEDGEIKVTINVLLNNRLFIPLKSTANIVSEDIPHETHDTELSYKTHPQEPVKNPEIILPLSTSEKVQAEEKRHKPKPEKKSVGIKLGLLKTVEPVKAKPKVKEEIKPISAKPTSMFSLKKKKITYK